MTRRRRIYFGDTSKLRIFPFEPFNETHLINLQTIGSNDPNTVFIRVDGAYPNLTSTFGAMYVL